jgi:uncharacterized membrane protein
LRKRHASKHNVLYWRTFPIKHKNSGELELSREIRNEISKSRIEMLTDGIFAIVMTLLVLEIAVPQLTHSEATTGELLRQLIELWPVIYSYALSFIILGFFWIGHHDQFYYIKRANRIFAWITIFYLMFIAFIPFSTALLGEYTDQQISVVIYGINIAVAGFWARVQWWYASKDHRLTDPDLEPTFVKIMSRRGTIGIVIYLIAAALSFVSIIASLVLFIVIPIYYLVPARTDKPWLWFTKNK